MQLRFTPGHRVHVMLGMVGGHGPLSPRYQDRSRGQAIMAEWHGHCERQTGDWCHTEPGSGTAVPDPQAAECVGLHLALRSSSVDSYTHPSLDGTGPLPP
ncbi:hypothetical protein EPR50_G00107900 [Perca flavescens]|uniref:Uncharacterized protein n=1 Tax=Perca flavescens TaxID=8167 RepID=A0A484CXU0_PERFV|nr:hypothetical protein EPR50_G00107900 [Perca flavescens]